ncbi:MAG: DUF2220 family protein [Lachnospiraceae bacterium]|nr:DUF2220 family protein [Lachnospiraceae bacterium]MDU3180599.1 DUF2220 family protein [Lachnospiraceae bacterium]
MKKILTLSQWIIEKTNVDSYRAGRLHGEKHPRVDQTLLNELGGMTNLLKQAEEMERDANLSKYIRFDWRDMEKDITKIHYSIEIIPLLCKKEGVEDFLDKQRKYIEKMETFLQEVSDTEWLRLYCNSILEKLKQGKVVKEMEDDNLFDCLKEIAKLQNPVWKRIFSANVLGNSKKFTKEYEKKVVGILRMYSHLADKDEMTDEEILKNYGILSYAQVLEWKGAVIYQLDTGKTVDTSDLYYGTIINSQTLEHSKPTALSHIRKIMTIENKANYENMMYEKDTLYIYCHGFFSPKEVKYLQELEKLADEHVEFYHWGDMDLGGIRIFLFNKEKIFPKLKPYKMNRESFCRAVEKNAGIVLEEQKRKRLGEMDAGELEELKECILEYGVEIEQEMLLGKD